MTRRDVIETSDPELPKATWGEGPWQSEPDRVEWRYGDIPCLLVRNRLGAWCGYAAVYPGHPSHGKDYREVEDDLDVHGGVTYSNECAGHVCHVARAGEPIDHVWWIGFDCGHLHDLAPGMRAGIREAHRLADTLGWPYLDRDDWGEYRDQAYAMDQAEQLARQLYEGADDGKASHGQ